MSPKHGNKTKLMPYSLGTEFSVYTYKNVSGNAQPASSRESLDQKENHHKSCSSFKLWLYFLLVFMHTNHNEQLNQHNDYSVPGKEGIDSLHLHQIITSPPTLGKKSLEISKFY